VFRGARRNVLAGLMRPDEDLFNQINELRKELELEPYSS
jgi:hypothetical protein